MYTHMCESVLRHSLVTMGCGCLQALWALCRHPSGSVPAPVRPIKPVRGVALQQV
uniref:Uncharacterized protein n=1 Tax=Anguilla anguilla TaxID=7936 RepID=A0A0E9RCC7_ANGAN